MKKFLVLGLVAVLSFSLVACSSNDAPEEEQVNEETTEEAVSNEPIELTPEEGAALTVWESQGPEGEFMRMVGEKFEEEYGVEVVYEEVDFTESVTRLLQDGPAGVGADVFAMPHDRLGEAYSAGIVYPNVISKERINNDFVDAARIATSYEGEL